MNREVFVNIWRYRGICQSCCVTMSLSKLTEIRRIGNEEDLGGNHGRLKG